jgi:drug/metabolite transporter (DMT)-like permease
VSFSAVFIRLASDDPATIVWVRMSMAAALLAPLLFVDMKRGRVPRTSRSAMLVALSGVFLAGHFLLWTASLQYTSIAASVLLVSMHPVAVIPLSRMFLGERTPPRTLIGMGVALAGTAITCIGDFRLSTTALAGDLLALGGAVCLAGYLLIGRGMRGALGVATYSFAVYAVVAVIAAVTALAQGVAHMPSARAALFGAGLAVICTIGGHTVYNLALRFVPSLSVSVAFLGEAPLTSLLALAVLATVPPMLTVIGGAIILIGVGLVVLAPTDQRMSPVVALE